MGSNRIGTTRVLLVLALVGAVYGVGTLVNPRPPAPPPPPPPQPTPEQVAAQRKEYWKQFRQMMMAKEGRMDQRVQQQVANLARTAHGRKILAARKRQDAAVRQVEIDRSGYFLENPMGAAGEKKAREEQKEHP